MRLYTVPVYVLLNWDNSMTSLKHAAREDATSLLSPGSSLSVRSTGVNDLLGVTTESMNLKKKKQYTYTLQEKQSAIFITKVCSEEL